MSLTADTKPSSAAHAGDGRSIAVEQLSKSFKAAIAAVRRLRGRETHRPGELSYAQYSLLFGLAHGGELSARELGCVAELSPATVTQMLDSLAAAGLVARHRSESDKRVVLTALTDRGAALVEERRARFEPRWQAALSEFNETELLSAARVLERLSETFDAFLAD